MFYGITLAELGWGRALLVALCGYVTVFLMMLALVCVIKVIGNVVGNIDAKKKAAAPAPAAKKAAPAAAAPAATQPATTNSAPLNTSDLGNDLDPNAGIDNTSAPAADNAAPATQPAAAPTAPAAAPADARTESIEVPNDTTVEEYSKQIMVSVEDLRRLNPAIPADGKLKGGTYLVIPSL